MFDHVTIRVADRAASERFYTGLLGAENAYSGEAFAEWGDFSLAAATEESPVTSGLSIILSAPAAYGPARDPDGNLVETVADASSGRIVQARITVADLAASSRFYESIAEFTARDHLLVFDGPSPSRNVHLAFTAVDDATVDAFHAAMLAAGYRDNGAPGERPAYHAGYYGAFVLDPDGNNVELVNHNR